MARPNNRQLKNLKDFFVPHRFEHEIFKGASIFFLLVFSFEENFLSTTITIFVSLYFYFYGKIKIVFFCRKSCAKVKSMFKMKYVHFVVYKENSNAVCVRN